MSDPNQFGLWLLIPFSLLALNAIHCRLPSPNMWHRLMEKLRLKEQQQDYMSYVLLGVVLVGIVMTFSRTAWATAFVIGVLALLHHLDHGVVQRNLVRTIAVLGFLLCLCLFLFPQVFVRSASTSEHIQRPVAGVREMIEAPIGKGIGTAGPASNRVSDACVHLESGADATWARAHPQLCVFVGGAQVQPIHRECQCPLVPENWYVQIGVEMGWVGFLLYIVLAFTLLSRLQKASSEHTLHEGVYLAYFGLLIASLSLHAWQDAAVAYTMWILMAASCPLVHPLPSEKVSTATDG